MTKKKDDEKPRAEAAPWKDGRKPKVTCTARTTMGVPCKRPPIKGSNVCRAHGGAAPQVRAAAQVRLLMSADAAAAKLIEMIHSKKVDDRTKLMAVKDLLDRANLAGTQNIEVGVTKRTFEDFVGDALVLVGDDDDVVDAQVVHDSPNPFLASDEPQTRSDRALAAEISRAARGRAIERSGGSNRAELERAEREALGAPARGRASGVRSGNVLAMNAQQDREDAELQRVKDAERRRNEQRAGGKRARTSDATMSQPRRRGDR